MKTEQKILKYFIEEKKPSTINEISKKIKSDYKITHTAIKRLIERKIINSQEIGKSNLCEMNENYYGVEIYRVEDERKNFLFKKKNILKIYDEILNKIKTNLFIFLIFGSYVKGKETGKSDIDLMFISNEKNFEEKIHEIISLIPLKVNFLVFNEKEFIQMKNSKESNVVKEAIQNNIILFGIENYYKIKND